MSAEPTDPLAFDYNLGFRPSADRSKSERADRLANADKAMPFHIGFLDDCLRALLPHDLILLGAATGVGKTELARLIATANAAKGKRVHYFALEAEPNEIERRIKFSILVDLMAANDFRVRGVFNYLDWYLGKFEGQLSEIGLDAEADAVFASTFGNRLHTMYRGRQFNASHIQKLFLAIQDQTDLIVLDHLHYVDVDDDNENRGLKKTIQLIRDTSLSVGKPVILVAHLRKRDNRIKSIVPSLDDFHGSSDVVKIATRAILLAPAFCERSPQKHIARTFMTCDKDRHGGATHMIACVDFDRRSRKYASNYTLGRQTKSGDKFEPLNMGEIPFWATRHQPLSTPMDPTRFAAGKEWD